MEIKKLFIHELCGNIIPNHESTPVFILPSEHQCFDKSVLSFILQSKSCERSSLDLVPKKKER